MGYKNKIATVFGGTGFVGRQIVRELAARGVTVRVATRVPERAYFLKPCGAVGQVVPFATDYNDAQGLERAVAGSDYVVNCIGILYERGKSTFQRAHAEIPAMIARASSAAEVKRLVHISALGVDGSSSLYAKTKLKGETAVFEHFPEATILRPSVIFGEDDNFFNMFAGMAQFLPFLPLIGGGKTRFQPVYVGDVAAAAAAALFEDGAAENPRGQVYELGGPDIVNFEGIYKYFFKYTGYRRMLVRVPFGVAKIQAAFLSLLPTPVLTQDQVESLKSDSVVSPDRRGFHDMGLSPRSMDLILPSYLPVYARGGRLV